MDKNLGVRTRYSNLGENREKDSHFDYKRINYTSDLSHNNFRREIKFFSFNIRRLIFFSRKQPRLQGLIQKKSEDRICKILQTNYTAM